MARKLGHIGGDELGRLIKPHLAAGRYDIAAELCSEAVAATPKSAELWRLSGIVALYGEKLDDAIKFFEETVKLAPESAAAHSALAAALLRAGPSSRQQARHELEAALAIDPRRQDDADTLVSMMLKEGEVAAARELLSRSLALGLQCPRACAFMASAELDEGKIDEASKLFILGAKWSPKVFTAIEACYLSLMRKMAFETARLVLAPLASAFPERAELKINLAVCQMQTDRFDECFESLKDAAALEPDSPPLLVNQGVALYKIGRFDESAEALRKALSIVPDDPQASLALSLSLLKAGKLKEGWLFWESRLKQPDMANISRCKLPLWTPSNSKSARILVRCEQGFGDSILFARFIPLLRRQCSHVAFICRRELLSLFAGFEGIDELIALGGPEEDAHGCDSRIPLASLPQHFIDSPDAIPKLEKPVFAVAPERVEFWRSFVAGNLPGGAKLKAGICFSGSQVNIPGRKRSIPAEELEPLFKIPGVAWFSLQADAEEGKLDTSAVRTSGLIKNFSDSAALIQELDIVVSIDTAVAHLSGSLLKPTLIALCAESDWRWFAGRNDSPWHPTARLFRQSSRNSWLDVIEAMREEVARQRKK